jgi:hypothetical protein
VTAPRFVREVLVPDQTVPLAVLAGCSTALADRESRQSASPDAVTQLEFAGHRITPGKTHTCTCHPAAGCRQISEPCSCTPCGRSQAVLVFFLEDNPSGGCIKTVRPTGT